MTVIIAAAGDLSAGDALKAGALMLIWGIFLGLATRALKKRLSAGSPITAGLTRGSAVVLVLGVGLLLYSGGLSLGANSQAMTTALLIGVPLAVIGLARRFKMDLSPLGRRPRPQK